MTTPVSLSALPLDLEAFASLEGRIAVLVDAPDALDAATRRINRLTRGAVARLLASDRFSKLKPGEATSLAFPAGLQAEAVDIVRLPRRATQAEARKAGVSLAKLKGKAALTVMAGAQRHAAELGLGVALRAYAYEDMKTPAKADDSDSAPAGNVTLMVGKPDEVEAALIPLRAIAEGVFLTRDLISAPANILTTTSFAARL